VRLDEETAVKVLLAANRPRMPSKEPAFSVGEDKSPTTEARLEQPVLGFEVFDERFLRSREPRSEHNDLGARIL